MENADLFIYVPLTQFECDDTKSAVISDETLEAKWRVIDYILKKIILKTD